MIKNILFFVYLTIFLIFTILKDINILILAIFLFSIFLVLKKEFFPVLKKILKFILPYVGIYLFLSYFNFFIFENSLSEESLSASLRVILLSMLSFFFIRRINLAKVLSFSKELSYIYVISAVHIKNFIQTLNEMRLALKSRGWRRRKLYFPSLFKSFFMKSIFKAEEVNHALRSRGANL